MDHERAEHLRKTVTGSAMIAAPLCFVVADSLWPVSGTDAAKILTDARGETARVYLAMSIGLIGVALLLGAFVGLAHLLHQRRPGMAFVGGALGMVGTLAIGVAIGTSGLVLFEAAQPGRDTATMTKLVDDLLASSMPVFAFTALTGIAAIVFAVGLQRTHVAASWSAACLAVGGVVATVANAAGLQPLIVAADVVLLVGLGSIGWTVIAETDEEWVTTPEFHGFARPVTAGQS
jgi:hypothetical protein